MASIRRHRIDHQVGYLYSSINSLIRANLLNTLGRPCCDYFVGFIDIGIMSIDSPSSFTWVIKVFIAAILCIGMSWSHIRRRMSGQADVNDI
ncbi:MAG: Golgi nucleoside diphosphatase [Oleiphilaceae bacterium]|jgi:Golgi nucleoside diphosphatase